MIARRVLLLAVMAAVLGSLIAGSVFGQKPKKKLRRANDSDGVNNVIGAWWEVNALNVATEKRLSFRFRAKDGVLYNKAGEEVGSLKPVKSAESRITWKESLPLQGEFTITMAKVGRWSGVLETEGGEKWKVLLRAVDR